MNTDLSNALDEITESKKELLAHIEAIQKQDEITVEDLRQIQEADREIAKRIDSIIEGN